MIAGSVVGLVYVMVTLFVAAYPLLGRGDASPGLVGDVGWVVGNWGTPLLLCTLTTSLVYLQARLLGHEPLLGGLLLGASGAAATAAFVWVAFQGLFWWEGPLYVAVGVGGAALGGEFARRARARTEAFGHAGRLAAAATNPADLCVAVGTALEPIGVLGTVIRAAQSEATNSDDAGGGTPALHPRAVWARQPTRAAGVGGLSSLRALPSCSDPRVSRSRDLSDKERHSWEAMGVRAGLALPLHSASGYAVGQLDVYFSRRFPSGSLPHLASSGPRNLAATAGLAVHNMALIERVARESALRAGRRYELDIHDTIVQEFAGTIWRLEAIDVEPLDDKYKDALRLALQSARSGMEQARRLASGTNELEAGTLWELVESAVRRLSGETGLEVAARIEGTPKRLATDTEIALLRVAQEGLNNVAQHSHATGVDVTLTYTPDAVALQIRDDGEGFDPTLGAADTDHRGITGMSERIRSVGGSLHLASSLGSGTRILAEAPVVNRMVGPRGHV